MIVPYYIIIVCVFFKYKVKIKNHFTVYEMVGVDKPKEITFVLFLHMVFFAFCFMLICLTLRIIS